MNKAKRYLWDKADAMGYEVQTSARSDAIEMNKAKSSLPITLVADNEEAIKIIK
ncbi:MAG: hypothetical protein ACP5U0_09815 [Caldisphaera sp.]